MTRGVFFAAGAGSLYGWKLRRHAGVANVIRTNCESPAPCFSTKNSSIGVASGCKGLGKTHGMAICAGGCLETVIGPYCPRLLQLPARLNIVFAFIIFHLQIVHILDDAIAAVLSVQISKTAFIRCGCRSYRPLYVFGEFGTYLYVPLLVFFEILGRILPPCPQACRRFLRVYPFRQVSR